MLPHFSLPLQGTAQNQRNLQASLTPQLHEFNLGVFGLQGQSNILETWQTAPTLDPDKINLLRLAYRRVLGLPQDDCAIGSYSPITMTLRGIKAVLALFISRHFIQGGLESGANVTFHHVPVTWGIVAGRMSG